MTQILQWNCHSIKNKKGELIHLINKHKPVILALSELWLGPDSLFRLSGFSCLRDDRDDGYAGAALLINRSLSYSRIRIPSHSLNFNLVAVRSLDTSFISIYIPNPSAAIFQELDSILSTIPGPLIILGDFNCHNRLWGCSKNDRISYMLIDLMDKYSLCILNDGSPTHRVFPNQDPNSALDLSLCSSSLASLLSWQVLSSTYGSDHFPCLISYPSKSNPVRKHTPLLKFKLKNADWNKFSSLTDLCIKSLPSVSPENVLDSYDGFVNVLDESAQLSFPSRNPSRKQVLSSPPWWDSDCSAAIERRKVAEKGYNEAMNESNFLNYQRVAAETKRLLSGKKRQGWISFCENLSPRTPSALVWKGIRRFRGSLINRNLDDNDTSSSWIEGFAMKLAPPTVPTRDCFPLPSPSVCLHRLDEVFSMAELVSVLDSLVDSSPGVDGIPYSFLKFAGSDTKQFYLDSINLFFVSGTIPEVWKTQIVIPILKPGKSPSDPSSYRPIALSSTLAKVTEHLIKNRLEWLVESKGLLASSQFGFRKGYSTMDSLSIITSEIRLAFSKSESVIGVFLDVSAAYDSVLLPVLRLKLSQLGIPVRLSNFICNLLMCRTILIRDGDSFLPPRSIWRGLPQGSVLSPLLYSIYTRDLEQSVLSFCKILQYADDLALFLPSRDLQLASNLLNSALMYLDVWLSEHGLSLSASKSSVVVFSRKRIVPDVAIKLNNQVIPVFKEVKFLGVILDSKLSGIPHLNYIIKKCEKGLNVLRCLAGVWWGAHPFSLKLVYNAIIRSHFDYGSFLLEPCNKRALGKLDKVQYRCLRVIIGAMKSSPTNALQVECSDPPLKFRRQYLSDRFFFNIVQLTGHPLVNILSSLASLISSSYWTHKDLPCLVKSFLKFRELQFPIFRCDLYPLYSIDFDALIFSPKVLLSFDISKQSPDANSKFNKKLNEEWSDWVSIFTDASKLSDDGFLGSAVWVPKFNVILNFKGPPQSSVFSGEAIAILEAARFVESHKDRISKALIFSDSLSCLQSIIANPFKAKNKFPVIFKVRQVLYSLHCQGIEIVLAWIPGHSGIHGNEFVDACAKDAVVSGLNSHWYNFCHDLRALASVGLQKSWSAEWEASRRIKCSQYASIQSNIPTKPWFFLYRDADRSVTSTVCRLRLGHACTPVFLAKIRVRDSSLCECGMDEGSMDHIFFNCPNLTSSLYDHLPLNFPLPTNFRSLLCLVFTPFIVVLCSFIQCNNIRL